MKIGQNYKSIILLGCVWYMSSLSDVAYDSIKIWYKHKLKIENLKTVKITTELTSSTIK